MTSSYMVEYSSRIGCISAVPDVSHRISLLSAVTSYRMNGQQAASRAARSATQEAIPSPSANVRTALSAVRPGR